MHHLEMVRIRALSLKFFLVIVFFSVAVNVFSLYHYCTGGSQAVPCPHLQFHEGEFQQANLIFGKVCGHTILPLTPSPNPSANLVSCGRQVTVTRIQRNFGRTNQILDFKIWACLAKPAMYNSIKVINFTGKR